MEFPITYQNGNTTVTIHSDGTKVREYKGVPKPLLPESMDVKITNYCDGNCPWCHEKSNIFGQHADLEILIEEIKKLFPGTEIALGGGNTLTHPALFQFLYELKQRKIIANITVNQKHVKRFYSKIEYLLKNELIHGLGISISNDEDLEELIPLLQISKNIVFHVIMGVDDVRIIDKLYSLGDNIKILILGYKDYGNGKIFLNNKRIDIENNKKRWYQQVGGYFRKEGLTLSFDNLAISQLNLKRFFMKDAWEKFYMGDEGKFSCYIDAVNEEFASCSVDSNRVKFGDAKLSEFFQSL